MNLLLLEKQDFIDEKTVRISGERVTHINQVLGSSIGDLLDCGKLNGLVGKGEIVSLTENKAELQVKLEKEPPTPLPLTVILALPRPKMLRRILRTIAELGVKEVHLINSYRVEKSYWQTPVLNQETMNSYLKQGLEQAKDTILPDVQLHKRFKPFVEDICPELIHNKEAFIAHPYTSNPKPEPSGEARIIAIGPEGGFIDYEIELLNQQGFTPFSIGQRIYRVETAIPLLSGISFCES